MDNKTKEKLLKIGLSIPKKLLQGAAPVEKGEDNRDLVERMIKSKNIPKEMKKTMAEDLKSGFYDPKDRIRVNPAGADKVEKYIEEKVNSALKKGEIKPAAKDAFMKRLQEKLRK